jgi:aquaglyceroporin related protein
MLWFYRGFPKRKMPEYLLAQFLAAFAAAFVAYGLYFAAIQYRLGDPAHADATADILNSFVTSRRWNFVDPATAFFNEFVGTAFLACTILALGGQNFIPSIISSPPPSTERD